MAALQSSDPPSTDFIFPRPDPKVLLSSASKKDCMFCVNQRLKALLSGNSPQITKIETVDEIKTTFTNSNEVIRNNLEQKYLTSKEYYNTKIVNDIIYNENTNVVSVFKDYLIFDDVSEFLKRQYKRHEAVSRLPKVVAFYDTYSKVFPNYVNIPENKFMFKNIERKQIQWDSRQQQIMEKEEQDQKKKAKLEDFGGVHNAPSSFFDDSNEERLFSSNFFDEVKNLAQLSDRDSSTDKIITLKSYYDTFQKHESDSKLSLLN